MMENKVTNETLQALRQQTDPVADEVITRIFTGGKAEAVNKVMAAVSTNQGEFSKELPPQVIQFFEQTSGLPAWADEKKMAQGALFFGKYIQQILSLLGSLSLPYCYAAADGAQVLYLSQRIRNDTRKRLADTGQFVLKVMSKDAFTARSTGIRTIQKVRLMHAAVRFHVLQSRQWNDAWGKPVNQEDMLGTNLAFSYIVLEGLQKLGVSYTLAEAHAYLHLWNVIGYLLGIQEIILPSTLKEALQLSKLIEKRHFRKSEAGVELTKALLRCFEEITPAPALKAFHPPYIRFLLGDKAADLLEIPQTNVTSLLITPVKAINYIRSVAGGFSSNAAYTQVSKAMLQIMEEENGKANYDIPVSLS